MAKHHLLATLHGVLGVLGVPMFLVVVNGDHDNDDNNNA